MTCSKETVKMRDYLESVLKSDFNNRRALYQVAYEYVPKLMDPIILEADKKTRIGQEIDSVTYRTLVLFQTLNTLMLWRN